MLADMNARNNQDFPGLSPLHFLIVIIANNTRCSEGLEMRLQNDQKEIHLQTAVREGNYISKNGTFHSLGSSTNK